MLERIHVTKTNYYQLISVPRITAFISTKRKRNSNIATTSVELTAYYDISTVNMLVINSQHKTIT